ncbi:MAG: TVP38/TMEM64 family protein [Bacillota bacterium]|nr:TVP38/TMEM64 family protein [Bacillota bacterium]
MFKKISSLIILVLIIAIGFYEKDFFISIIKEGGSTSILISMLVVAITVFFPIIPFPVLAGLIGAVFGTVHAVFITLSGAMFGTMALFFLCRYGFRDWAQAKLSKYPKIQEYETYIEKHSFLSVLASRVVPIIPAPVVNIFCSLSKINWLTFFTASALGKIPNVLLLSFAGASFTRNKYLSLGLYGAYMAVIFIIYFIIVYRRMSKEA